MLVAGHDRQPVEIGAHRLVGAVEPRSQIDGLLEISGPMTEAPGMRAVCALRFRAGKPHDDRGFRLFAGAGRRIPVEADSSQWVGKRP